MNKAISITLPDGSERQLPKNSTGADLAASIGQGLAKAALAYQNESGEIFDLAAPLQDGAQVQIITGDSDKGLEIIRHSTAHVLAQAVLALYPGATFAIGPAIENGFYYDFELPEGKSLSDEDLAQIEVKMKEIVAANQLFQRHEASAQEALKIFEGHSYKCEIINSVSQASSTESEPDSELTMEMDPKGVISYYQNGDGFNDLCRGPHVPSTGKLPHFALEKVAGAYWRSNETRPVLQRVYGTAWNSAKDLKSYLNQLKEAALRDHRRLAKDLDLLSWSNKLGPGLAIWHPKGAVIRNLIEDYSRKRHLANGYEYVYSPHIAKSDLWETSGHLEFYAESMYPAMEMEGADYYPKPMNCPFHLLAFSNTQRSYKELPLRFYELGTVYRFERSGVIHGLLRSRGFTQDDSHIFCTQEQLPQELDNLLSFVLSVLGDFGFTEFQAKLSTRPKDKYVGELDLWELATNGLQDTLTKAGLDYKVDEGGGAFYGPKIDVDVTDAIGRNWQLSTIQVDFNLPERFDLSYIGNDGQKHRPVMVHRALMGSIERFFGVLLEHYAGAFPLWLAPEQVRVLPVAGEFSEYGQNIVNHLAKLGFRAVLDDAVDPLSKRIRNAKLQKLPYVLVVGQEDVDAGTVGVNPRGQDVKRGVSLADFSDQLKTETGGF